MTEMKVYKAADGTLFDKREDCEAYEKEHCPMAVYKIVAVESETYEIYVRAHNTEEAEKYISDYDLSNYKYPDHDFDYEITQLSEEEAKANEQYVEEII